MLDIRKLRYFIAVYEAGSISKAAEREHIVQPALTVRIQQLEEEFQCKLFERSTLGVSPTPAGRHFYTLCLDLLRRLEATSTDMRQFSGPIAGTLNAGIMPTICHGSLAPALKRYSETYPNVEIRVVEGLSGTLAEWVLADKLDFAVCHRPASARGFELRLLVSDALVLVSGAHKALARFAPCNLREVPDLKLVLPSRNHTLRHVLDEQIERGGLRPVKMLEIDGQSAMLQFVSQSDWSTVLPRLALINEFESTRFIINPIVEPRIASDIYELRSSRNALSLAAARFIALLEGEIQAAPELPKPA